MEATMTITMTRPSPTAAPAVPTTAPSLYLTVNLTGRLSTVDRQTGADGAALARRTTGGTVHRVSLASGITAWLDGEEQNGSGELNWVATHMLAALCSTAFTCGDDAPFVCGPVVFTATAVGEPVGLSDAQVVALIDAHAAVDQFDADFPGLSTMPGWDR
jgi:hypothetical protein